MTLEEFKSYIKQNYSSDDFFKSLSDISKPENTPEPLVEGIDIKIYDFDKIVRDNFEKNNLPASADGLFFGTTGNEIVLIEFKSGFYQKITIDTFNINECDCPYYPEESHRKYCNEYGKILLNNQKLKINELLDSLKLKTIESYLFLEKLFFNSEQEITSFPINLIVVVDANILEAEESLLGELAGKDSISNKIQDVEKALNRFHLPKYNMYKKIKVFSATDFSELCRKMIFSV